MKPPSNIKSDTMNHHLTKYAAHWRDSARRPRFFWIDARVSLLLLFFLLHMRLWTFLLALIGVVALSALEYFNFTLEVFVRWLRNQLAGSRKVSIPWWMMS